MKKENFVSLVLGAIGGLMFALGMCMALIAEWNAFVPGVVFGAIGIAVLLIMWIVRRKMLGKEPIQLSVKTIQTIMLAVAGALVLGVGMCMIMVWSLMIPGILVGIVGIVLLICLIPLTVGLK